MSNLQDLEDDNVSFTTSDTESENNFEELDDIDGSHPADTCPNLFDGMPSYESAPREGLDELHPKLGQRVHKSIPTNLFDWPVPIQRGINGQEAAAMQAVAISAIITALVSCTGHESDILLKNDFDRILDVIIDFQYHAFFGNDVNNSNKQIMVVLTKDKIKSAITKSICLRSRDESLRPKVEVKGRPNGLVRPWYGLRLNTADEFLRVWNERSFCILPFLKKKPISLDPDVTPPLYEWQLLAPPEMIAAVLTVQSLAPKAPLGQTVKETFRVPTNPVKKKRQTAKKTAKAKKRSAMRTSEELKKHQLLALNLSAA